MVVGGMVDAAASLTLPSDLPPSAREVSPPLMARIDTLAGFPRTGCPSSLVARSGFGVVSQRHTTSRALKPEGT